MRRPRRGPHQRNRGADPRGLRATAGERAKRVDMGGGAQRGASGERQSTKEDDFEGGGRLEHSTERVRFVEQSMRPPGPGRSVWVSDEGAPKDGNMRQMMRMKFEFKGRRRRSHPPPLLPASTRREQAEQAYREGASRKAKRKRWRPGGSWVRPHVPCGSEEGTSGCKLRGRCGLRL